MNNDDTPDLFQAPKAVTDPNDQLYAEDYSTHTPMTDAEVLNFIRRHHWTFARTMAHIPHEYTLRKQARTDEEFVRMVKHIRQFGYDAKWGKHHHRYLDIGGWKYWTMGYLTSTTVLINRAELKRGEAEHPRVLNPTPFTAKFWPAPWDKQ